MTDVATPTSPKTNPQAAVAARLSNRDYTLIIDKSGSMATSDVPGYKNRWEAVKESVQALARKIDEYDPDGITVYPFSGGFKRYDNVTPDKVDQIFSENEPSGGTNLHLVLKDALDNWEERKAKNELKGGETIIVVTDGQPNDEHAVANVIKRATTKMDKDEELAILFLQIGKDEGARQFLKHLDDGLPGDGAKFDAVDTKTFDELENSTFSEALISAIDD